METKAITIALTRIIRSMTGQKKVNVIFCLANEVLEEREEVLRAATIDTIVSSWVAHLVWLVANRGTVEIIGAQKNIQSDSTLTCTIPISYNGKETVMVLQVLTKV